jgi:hypothetical protein
MMGDVSPETCRAVCMDKILYKKCHLVGTFLKISCCVKEILNLTGSYGDMAHDQKQMVKKVSLSSTS